MKKALLLIFTSLTCTFNVLQGATWDLIDLPNEYLVPENLSTHVYSTQLPTSPLFWTETSECNTYQPPSIHWKSDLITNIKGISFKGLVFKLPELKNQGSPQNSFAVFFHEQPCYMGGSEYGWFFSESGLPHGQFYLSNNSNLLGEQKSLYWPAESMHIVKGSAASVKMALKNSGVYRYWNIIVTVDGDFTLQLVDPSTYRKVSVTLKKPDWMPNLYNVSGYVTVTAKKQAETIVLPPPYMHVDDVKTYK